MSNLAPAPDETRILSTATLRAADLLAIKNAELAAVIGLSTSMISKMRKHGAPLPADPKARELSTYFLRIFRSLDAIVGGDTATGRAWLRNPNTALGDQPLALMKSIRGLVAVMEYLDQRRAPSEPAAYAGIVWRFVEDQHRASTLKLVDGLDEQALLEDILDATKPPVPEECRHLDYLLYTPFRYPARHATRFRRKGEVRGVLYAAETLRTAAAEMAHYRWLFFLESPATAPPVAPMRMTGFSLRVETPLALDLPALPDPSPYRHPTDYAPCHGLADAARAAGIEAIRYPSARLEGGINLAVLTCPAIAEPKPLEERNWVFRVTGDRVIGMDRSGAEGHEFTFADLAARHLSGTE